VENGEDLFKRFSQPGMSAANRAFQNMIEDQKQQVRKAVGAFRADAHTALRDAIKTAIPKTSIKEMALKLDISYDKLNNMCNGRTTPTLEVLEGVKRLLALPAGWPQQSGPIYTSLAGTPMLPVPVVGSVSAGRGITNVDVDEDMLLVPERLAYIGGVGFVIDGDSMMPHLHPGDIALFKEERHVRDRYTHLIKTSDGEYKVKDLVFESGRWMLVSKNPLYPKIMLGEGDEVLGLLVGYFRSQGSREIMESDPTGLYFA
jgi:SOS-response transcriptional repressor LexA